MNTRDDLAPIVLFCYNRPWHLRQTIESLKQNELAHQSDLILYSDGPKNETDRPLINEVRSYLTTISGFRSVTVFNADKNKGLANSVIQGVTATLANFEKVIVLEDDMLSTRDFLTYMNDALTLFRFRPAVFSISAYAPPVIFPAGYHEELYLAPRASSWGWGTWNDRWQRADWQVKDFATLKNNKNERALFQKGGEDLWPMLVKQQRGFIDSWAIRWTYSQFKNNAYGVYPVRSKIKNIGTDGSGTNFTFSTGYYGNELFTGTFTINPDVMPDADVMDAFARYYRLPFLLKIKNRIKYRV